MQVRPESHVRVLLAQRAAVLFHDHRDNQEGEVMPPQAYVDGWLDGWADYVFQQMRTVIKQYERNKAAETAAGNVGDIALT